MDRFDAGFELIYYCMHKLVIYVLNDPVEIKILRNITENSPNKENVFFFSSLGIDQMLPVTSSHWPLEWKHISLNLYSNEHSTHQFDSFSMGKKFSFLVLFIQKKKEAKRKKTRWIRLAEHKNRKFTIKLNIEHWIMTYNLK